MASGLERFKEWTRIYRKEIVFIVIVFLVAALSFGLGYLANREFNHVPIIIQKSAE